MPPALGISFFTFKEDNFCEVGQHQFLNFKAVYLRDSPESCEHPAQVFQGA